MLNFTPPRNNIAGFFVYLQKNSAMIVATVQRWWTTPKIRTQTQIMCIDPLGKHELGDYLRALRDLLDEEVGIPLTFRPLHVPFESQEVTMAWYSPVAARGMMITVANGVRHRNRQYINELLTNNGYAVRQRKDGGDTHRRGKK